MKIAWAYIAVFASMLAALALLPKRGGYVWQPELINTLSALLFTLLVWLTGRIADTLQTWIGVFCTAVFVLFFCPDSKDFFNRDETAIITLTSICIVPFFISQYNRVAIKDFKQSYFLMLLMGIFCSYTHDSITIPLCASFITLAFIQRQPLFRLACWPMVIGFVIGTALSVWQSFSWGSLDMLSQQTVGGLHQLWETKVFMCAMLLTIYFLSSRRKRRKLLRVANENKLITYCLLYSFCAIPFAPLGLENAISGTCFFCMFWVLFLFRQLFRRE